MWSLASLIKPHGDHLYKIISRHAVDCECHFDRLICLSCTGQKLGLNVAYLQLSMSGMKQLIFVSRPQNLGFWEQNRGRMVRCWPNKLVLSFGGCYALIDTNWIYNLSHAICYSYRPDKNFILTRNHGYSFWRMSASEGSDWTVSWYSWQVVIFCFSLIQQNELEQKDIFIMNIKKWRNLLNYFGLLWTATVCCCHLSSIRALVPIVHFVYLFSCISYCISLYLVK